MTGPGLEDAEKAIRYGYENCDLAAAAGDDAERSSRYRQAALAFSSAGRIFAAWPTRPRSRIRAGGA
jgi:hypothetical protein